MNDLAICINSLDILLKLSFVPLVTASFFHFLETKIPKLLILGIQYKD